MCDKIYIPKSGAKKAFNRIDTRYRHFGEQTDGNDVRVFIDGEETFSSLYKDLLNAKKQIWIAGLDIWPNISLLRNSKSTISKLAGVLRWIAKHHPGIQILILIYEPSAIQQAKFDSAKKVKEDLQRIIASSGLQVRLDSTVTGQRVMENIPIIGPSWSGMEGAAHQKMIVIDGEIGYCGGLDLAHGRWDTQDHFYGDNRRDLDKDKNPVVPWHDVHARVVGPAVWDLQLNFLQRWYYSDKEDKNIIKKWEREQNKPGKYRSVHGLSGKNKVKMSRTWKQAEGVQCNCLQCNHKGKNIDAYGIQQDYEWLFKSAENFIYIENQYAFQNKDITNILIKRLHKQPSLKVIIVLPIQPDLITTGKQVAVGFGKVIGTILPVTFVPDAKIMVFTPTPFLGESLSDLSSLNDNLQRLRNESQGRVKTFCLVSHQGMSFTVQGETQKVSDIKVTGASIYVHAKVVIVDDRYLMLGSANLDDWGMKVSSELNILVDNASLARDVRVRLWKEHLCRWKYESSKFGNDDWIEWWTRKGHTVGGKIFSVADLDLNNPSHAAFGLELWDRLAYHNVCAVRDIMSYGQLRTEEWVGKIYPYAYKEMKAPPPYHGAEGGGVGGS